VPTNYNPAVAYGLLVWLHGPGGFENDALVARWKEYCERDGFILVAPKAGDPAKWTVGEVELAAQAIERIKEDYHVDPSRIVAHGYQGGAGLACLLAFAHRDLVRGVAVVHGPILGQFPDNDPEQPLAFYVTTSKEPDLTKPLAALRDRKFPVTVRSQGEKGRYLNDDERAELLRWFDSLDRI
jgi:poly(3-hydroxybutyrate) depolymerase